MVACANYLFIDIYKNITNLIQDGGLPTKLITSQLYCSLLKWY